MTGPLMRNKILFRSFQWFLVLLLFMTGIGKLLDVPGFIQVLRTYQALPEWALPIVAIGLVLLELKTAEWLMRNKTLILGAMASLALHSMFTLLTLVTLFRGLEIPNCGCFGVFLARPLTGWTVVEDLVLVAISFGLLIWALKQRHTSSYPRHGKTLSTT